jgi:hypothetical protein
MRPLSTGALESMMRVRLPSPLSSPPLPFRLSSFAGRHIGLGLSNMARTPDDAPQRRSLLLLQKRRQQIAKAQVIRPQ